jgi:large subunit ribosomal protein L7/L12
MMYASAASPAAKPSSADEEEAAEAPVKQEKTTFSVRLIKYDDAKKVAVIKEIKNLIAGMNLVQAKKFVESVPQTVKSDISKDEAEKLKATLDAVGAMVEID